MNRQVHLQKGVFIRLALLLFCAITSASDSKAQVAQTKFLTHSVAGQTYTDNMGELRGKEHGGRRAFNIELVREMMQITGQASRVEEMPFKRALMRVQSSPNLALFNVNRTQEREPTMKWVGPLQKSVTHFYENKTAPTGVKSLEEAKEVESICVLRGNVHHRYLERQGFENIYPANSYTSCVRMLALNRVSMTPLSDLSSLVQNPRREATSNLQKTTVMLMESEGYLAFSKETPDEEIKRWQAALDALKSTGRYDELMRTYLWTE